MDEAKSNVIDYRVLYERLKDGSAATWTREMELFSLLYFWKINDTRKEERPSVGT
ncbi:MAG: hypothetical protein E7L01_09695 [Paenibacillus macerans]|uniref:hypothetical protein n=1 Tax=Paenibacillus macerans TaxID=44252 RepID=UPI001F106CD8|nr:hypothetical protein [Paenibacillus macerans]MDU7473598.1 hypothetical protein [Paenibacillus macerans]MEC0139182.1 hypothetical protein [Paenibacillus macerans]UMV47263.1 hypothetical protein LMZ02_28055 [Paenibacillus macerans]